MCNETRPVCVKIPADLDASGMEQWKDVKIDACVADVVSALQAAGIDMRGSCCGHGRKEGHVHLEDGRALLVLPREAADRYFGAEAPRLQLT